MSSTKLFRIAARAQPSSFLGRNAVRAWTPRAVYAAPSMIATTGVTNGFSSSAVRKSDAHAEESFEEFSARYVVGQWLGLRWSVEDGQRRGVMDDSGGAI
jgi:hypothetical protein